MEVESLEHEAHVPSFDKVQQLKATDFARLNTETKLHVEGAEMMSCCLTKETHPPDEERNCRVGGKRTESSALARLNTS